MRDVNIQIFKGPQEKMCEATRLGLNLYNKDQPVFQKMNLKYDKEWSADREKEIDAALAMPDVHTRRSVPSSQRDKLVPLAQTCADNWLILSGIIRNVAPANEVESLLLAAGSANYEEATKNNWTKVKALNTAGNAFIADNMDLLLNGGKGMSPDFPKTFTDSADAYEEGMSSFYDAKQDMPSETNTKVDAMNDVYTTLQSMLRDGRILFKRDKAKRESYTYTSLLAKVEGPGKQSGYRFTLQQEEVLIPVEVATVTLIPTGAVYSTSEKGIIEFVQKSGKYKYTLTAPGFVTISGIITIKPGVIGRKKLLLKKAAETTATTEASL